MLLAELEVFHSRHLSPTRRVALGRLVLPVEPAPGLGGLLLAGVVAHHFPGVDPDLGVDFERFCGEVERGDRIVQPRLRHRYQVDRHGLAVATHRLTGEGDSVRLEIQPSSTPLAQVLGAVYAIERLDAPVRSAVVPLVRRAAAWRGPLDDSFVTAMLGRPSAAAASDPRAWALDLLGFPGGTLKVTRREVMVRYRSCLREAHPDHGGDARAAHRVIEDLAAARRVLLGRT